MKLHFGYKKIKICNTIVSKASPFRNCSLSRLIRYLPQIYLRIINTMNNTTKSGIFSILFIFLIPNHLNGQTGSIEGIITDKKSTEILIGTTVQVDGTTIGTTTDLNGHFVLSNLDPGKYNLKISYISYTTRIINNVNVERGKITTLNVELEASAVSLGDITVSAIKRSNTEISMITDIKSSQFVSTGISGQQISKTLDKDASEVVKRVPGITIMDNRFLIVRGLSPRHNNVWPNHYA